MTTASNDYPKRKIPLKRQLRESEIPIFDNAYIHQRGDYWQLHMWLEQEGKYARKSLRTRSQSTAVERAKQLYMEISAAQLSGKTYFSLTVKQGVAQYLAAREQDVELGLITRDRYITLRSQLKHWQEFIGRETRLRNWIRQTVKTTSSIDSEYLAALLKISPCSMSRARLISVCVGCTSVGRQRLIDLSSASYLMWTGAMKLYAGLR